MISFQFACIKQRGKIRTEIKYLPVFPLSQQSEKWFPHRFSECPDAAMKTFHKKQAPWRVKEEKWTQARHLVKNPAF